MSKLCVVVTVALIFFGGIHSSRADLASRAHDVRPLARSLWRELWLGVRRGLAAAFQEQQRQQSLQLSAAFAEMAQSDTLSAAVSNEFWKSFQVCGECHEFMRLGEASDGGYLTCVDGIQARKLSAAYSMGVQDHDKWSEDVTQLLTEVPVHQADCTVSWSTCRACTFHKKCIVAADGKHPVPGHEGEGWSLAQTLEKTSQDNAADRSLLMKMDIEGSEWPIFASETSPGTLRKFAQLIVEFHGLSQTEKHPMYLTAMQNILGAGFRVAHLHGNNYEGMYHPNATHRIPNVVEVTFVDGDPRKEGCAPEQILIRGLDAPNKVSAKELPLARFG